MTTRDVATKLARHVFKTRGNHAEVHLSEEELASLFQVVSEFTLESQPTPMAVEACVRKP